MLPAGFLLKFGSAFREARNARDPKKIALALGDVPETVLKVAARHGVVWRLDAHAVDCVEDPKLILASMGVQFLDISSGNTKKQHHRLKIQLQLMFEISDEDVKEELIFARWLASQLGGPESKMHWLAKRLDELADTNGFLNLMDLLKIIIKDVWSEEQSSALEDVKRIFRIS